MLVALVKDWNGRGVGNGVQVDEDTARQLISMGIGMEVEAYRKMKEAEKKQAVKAPEAPPKDKMVHAPKKKK